MSADPDTGIRTAGPWEVGSLPLKDALPRDVDRVVVVCVPSLKRVVALCGGDAQGKYPEATIADAHLIAAAPDYHAALLGDEDPNLHRLAWLETLLRDIKESTYFIEHEDPMAAHECVQHVWDMVHLLRQAQRKAGPA